MSTGRPGAGVVAGAGVPHAPQFWAMPDTEDADQVAAIRTSMADIGRRLIAHEPDVLILVGNDHTENFYRACVPAFAVHCGNRPAGSFAERRYSFRGAAQVGLDLVQALQGAGFDPAFTQHATVSYAFGIPMDFCEIPEDLPVLPIFVNAYLPPQPSPERCFAFGRALHTALAQLGLRAVVLASGGMSHYPGTDRYSTPDVATDQAILDALKTGRTRELLAYDMADLDETGNLELLPWIVLAGAIGQRVPDVWAFEASWHHTYMTVGWTEAAQPRGGIAERVYPGVVPALQGVSSALYALRYDLAGACAAFVADPGAFARSHEVEEPVADAFADLDDTRLRAAGVHPFLVSGAIRAVNRLRERERVAR